MKINISNRKKIEEVISKVERKAINRKIFYYDIIYAVEKIEKRLSGCLRKYDWRGLKFECDPNAQSFPSSYKYRPNSTHFCVERGASAWFVTEIWIGVCLPPSQGILPINIRGKRIQIAEFVSQPMNWK